MTDVVKDTDHRGNPYLEIDLGDGQAFRVTRSYGGQFLCSVRKRGASYPLPVLDFKSVGRMMGVLSEALEDDLSGKRPAKPEVVLQVSTNDLEARIISMYKDKVPDHD